MGRGFWFRVGMMAVALGAVVWAIHSINERGLNPHIAAAVGVVVPPNGETRVDLCESRVEDLKTTSGIELYEKGMSWFIKKQNKAEKKLDPIAVEKWFGTNCSVYAEDLRPIALSETQAAKPVLIFSFVHGVQETVKETAAGEYIWRKIKFKSKQLTDALSQLADLRESGKHGHPAPTED